MREPRLLLRLLLGAVAVEAVAAQHRAHHQMRAQGRREPVAGERRRAPRAQAGRWPGRRLPRRRAASGRPRARARSRPPARARAPGASTSALWPFLPWNSATASARLMAPPVAASSPCHPTASARLAFRDRQHERAGGRQGGTGDVDIEHEGSPRNGFGRGDCSRGRRACQRVRSAPGIRRGRQAAGGMFGLRRKTFAGSNFRLRAARRGKFAPYAACTRAAPSSPRLLA